MKKGGQVTVFIIIAIIIVVIVVAFFTLFSSNRELSEKDGNLENPEKLLEDCIEVEGLKSLAILGLRGGDIEQKKSINLGDNAISYLFYENKKQLESLEEIRSDFEVFFLDNVNAWIDNFSYFSDQGYEIKVLKFSPTISLSETVSFAVDYSLTKTKGDNSILFEDNIDYVVPVNFSKYYKAADNIVWMREELGGTVDFFYLLEQDLNVTMSQEGDSLFFLLEDGASVLNEEIGYVYSFAIQVGGGNETLV